MSAPEARSTDGKQRRVRNHPEPPRPCPEERGLPLLGLIPELRRDGAITAFDSRRKRLGDVHRLRMGRRWAVVVSHPDAFERVLVGHERRYVKGNVYDAPRELLGMGLVTLEGDAWKERRRLMQPHFHRAAPRRAETSRAWRQTAIWSAPSALTSAPAGRSRMGRLESLPPTSSS
jgi:cytochrome P450